MDRSATDGFHVRTGAAEPAGDLEQPEKVLAAGRRGTVRAGRSAADAAADHRVGPVAVAGMDHVPRLAHLHDGSRGHRGSAAGRTAQSNRSAAGLADSGMADVTSTAFQSIFTVHLRAAPCRTSLAPVAVRSVEHRRAIRVLGAGAVMVACIPAVHAVSDLL